MRSVLHPSHAPASRALVRLALVLLAFTGGQRLRAQPSYAVQGGYVPPTGYQPSAMPSAYRAQGSPPPAGMNVAQPQQPYYYYQQAPTQYAPSGPSRTTAKPSTKSSTTGKSSSSANKKTTGTTSRNYVPSSAGRSGPRSALPVEEPQPASSDYRYDYEPYAYPDPPPPAKVRPKYEEEEGLAPGFASAVREDIADLWSNDRRQDQRIAELERDTRYGQRSPVRQDSGSRYTVRYGDSLSEIAAEQGTTVAALRSANGLRSDVLLEGQTLVIPTRGGSSNYVKPEPRQTTRQSSANGTHIVQQGESLSTIASAYRVSLASLQSANGIKNANLISVGRRLTIPGRTAPVTPVKKSTVKKQSSHTHYVSRSKTYTPATPAAGSGTQVQKTAAIKSEPLMGGIASYRVQPDDTLDSIAHHFNTKSDELRRINSLTDGYRPQAGDELVVPSPAPVAL